MGEFSHGLPELHVADWRPTKHTLHLYAQIVGKVRLTTTPPRNHSSNVPLWRARGDCNR